MILVDMDDVISDYEHRFIEVWRERYPDAPYVKFEDRRTLFIEKQYPEQYYHQIKEIMHERGFYASFKEIPGAIDALKHLDSIEPVYIVSSPSASNPYCVHEKFIWIRERLGKSWEKKMIFTKDKTPVRGKILIDDKPEVTGAVEPEWQHIVFNKPYNQESSSPRMDWGNYRSVLKDYIRNF